MTSHKPKSKPAKRHASRTEIASLFNPAVFLATAAPGREMVRYAKKDVIFSQGEDANSVFYIRKGRVKLAVLSKQGKEAVVALLGPDEFIGEGCLIG